MVIKNLEQLATSPLRRQALQIAEAGLEAINTQKAFEIGFLYNAKKDQLEILRKRHNLSEFRNIYCIAFGKAAFAGIASVASILGERLTAGFAIDVSEQRPNIPKVILRTGTHPHPSEQNVKAAKELVAFLGNVKANDLVISLISGGGSALLCYPHSLTVATQAEILKAMMAGGADIFEMNAVRKHLSAVKGGQLAKIIYPAATWNLIFSDVPGDDLSTIASGPTVKDLTTAGEARKILDKYQILNKLDLPAVQLLETPKEDKYFAQVRNILFVSGQSALNAMRDKAEDLGFQVRIFSRHFQGKAMSLAGEILKANGKRHQVLLGAGESTVVVKGKGVGGRNQEMALAALTFMASHQVLITIASDGHDNSESAGAVVDASTLTRSKALNLEPETYLENNDSFHFFESLGDSLQTGLTGSNVADLFVCLNE